MRQGKGKIWDFFTKCLNYRARCLLCNQSISYLSTTHNLTKHLKRKHKRDVRVVSLVNKHESRLSWNVTEAVRTKHDVSIFGEEDEEHISVVQKKYPVRPRVINRRLLDLFIKDFQPFDIVKEENFLNLVKLIRAYNVPSKGEISSVLIPTLYQKHFLNIKHTVQNEEINSVSISVDTWHNIFTTEKYLTITAHYISRNYKFKSILLECISFIGRCSSFNLLSEMRRILVEWNLLDKVNFAVYDEKSAVKHALELIFKLKHCGCYANKLNSIVQCSLEKFNCASGIFDKIREIACYFETNMHASNQLLNYQMSLGCTDPKSLTEDIPARWHSTFYMIRQFVELMDYLKYVIPLLNKDSLIVSDDEWDLCKHICTILSPFEELTSSMSAEKYMRGSSVIVVTRCLIGICEKFSESEDYPEIIETLITVLKKELTDQFHDIENNIAFAACTILDPRYKNYVFQNAAAIENVKKHLIDTVKEMIEFNEAQEHNIRLLITASKPTSIKYSENKQKVSIFMQDYEGDILDETIDGSECSSDSSVHKKNQSSTVIIGSDLDEVDAESISYDEIIVKEEPLEIISSDYEEVEVSNETGNLKFQSSAPQSSFEKVSAWDCFDEIIEETEEPLQEQMEVNNATLRAAENEASDIYIGNEVDDNSDSSRSQSNEKISAWNCFDEIMDETVTIQDTAKDIAEKEVEFYLNDNVLPRLNENGEPNCPLQWWKQHQSSYPNLSKIVRSKCNIVASSVPCDRIFSEIGFRLNERRARLSENVPMLMFLNGNTLNE